MATTAQTVQSYYQNILFRSGDADGVAYWTNQIDNVGYTDVQVENLIATSTEAQTYVAPIVQYYEADLGRAADTAGLSYWVHQAESGMSMSAINAAIQSSAEGQAYIGNGGSVSNAFITKLYSNILNRAPDSAGLSYWANSGLTAAQIEDGIRTSAEGQQVLGSATTNYLLAIGSGNTVSGTLFNATGNPGETFTLTTGVDTITPTTNNTGSGGNPGAGNDTFLATVTNSFLTTTSTLNPGDTLDGGGGSNTLKIIDTAGSDSNDLAGVTVSNVQTVSVQNASAHGEVAVDFTNAPGVSKVIALDTSSDGASRGRVVDSFTNLATGSQVVVSGSTTPSNTIVDYSMKTGTDAVSLGVDGGVNGVKFIYSGNPAAAPTNATISSTGSANGSTKAGLSDTFYLGSAASVTSLTVNAATNLVASLDSADYGFSAAPAVATALTVSGAGSVDLLGGGLDFATIDASQSSGGVTITDSGTSLKSFTGGVGNDSLTLVVVTPAGFTFNGGAGNNTLNVAANELHTLTSGSQLDGGTGGTNTLVINDTALTSADYTALNAVKDFGVLGLGTAASIDASKVATAFPDQHFALMNTGPNAISGLAAGTTTVDISAATTDDTFSVGTGANTLNLNIGTSETAGLALGTESVTGFQTINVTSNGKAATPATPNTVTFNNSDNTTFNVSGSEDLNMTVSAGTTTGDTIDASKLTGALNLTASNQSDVIVAGDGNSTINAGAGNDVITVGSGTNTITGGMGADTITINHGSLSNIDTMMFAGGDSSLTAMDAINGFVAGVSGDVLNSGVGSIYNALSSAQLTSIAADASLSAAVTDAATDANKVGWTAFNFGGNTYAESTSVAGSYSAGADNVVNLKSVAVASLKAVNFA